MPQAGTLSKISLRNIDVCKPSQCNLSYINGEENKRYGSFCIKPSIILIREIDDFLIFVVNNKLISKCGRQIFTVLRHQNFQQNLLKRLISFIDVFYLYYYNFFIFLGISSATFNNIMR